VSSQAAEYHDAESCDLEVWAHAEREINRLNAPEVIGFYALSCQVAAIVRLLKIARERFPSATTVLGGPHVAMAPEDAATLGFDYVVADLGGGGGGEEPFLRLLRQLKLGISSSQIVRAMPGRHALHYWPWPDRSLLDIHSYEYLMQGERTATIVTQRGCPYACSFCSHTAYYRKIEYRDHAHVASELRELREKFGYRAVMLYDDEVQISYEHFKSLCAVLGKENWIWRAFIKSNLFTSGQAKLAAQSGAIQLCTGAESASPEIKKHILKKSTVDDDTRFVQLCLDNGIAPKTFTVIGLAGESDDTAGALEDWLLARIADGLIDFDVTVYTPYPGTPMWEAFKKTKQYIAPGGAHGLRLVQDMDFAGETTHYKGRSGEYVSRVETFDPRTGKTLLTAEQIVAWRDRIDRVCREAVARRGNLTRKGDG